MKKPSFKIRDEIVRLQEQLRLAEAREAERIGRIALRAGFGDIDVDETEIQTAFVDLVARFRQEAAKPIAPGDRRSGEAAVDPFGAAQGGVSQE